MPIPCDVGKYCEQGSHTPTGSCTEGYTCELIQYDYTDTIVDRPAWVNIFESATVQGTLTYDGIEFCMNEDSANCWRGHYQAATVGNECPQGYYCPGGSFLPKPCPIGTYNDLTQRTKVEDCEECPAGQYCSSHALVTPQQYCEAGYYCGTNQGSSYINPCEAGHYCPANS